MILTFLGAAGTVTGSGFVVTSDSGDCLVVDLGRFQGTPNETINTRPLALDVSSVCGVVLTHAHLDHCGRLPLLVKRKFKGPIFTTAASRELTQLSLYDSAKLEHDKPKGIPLFTHDDVKATMKLFQIANYRNTWKVGPFTVELYDAGHILGSASVLVEVDGKRIVFSGDLGKTPEPITRATDYIQRGDVVVMESTYGDRVHAHGEPQDALVAEIAEIKKNNGTLIIPAFSLERTQELLHMLYHMDPDVRVYLDSPMGEQATAIYSKYPKLMNEEIARDFKTANPFTFANLRVVQTKEESDDTIRLVGPKVIIAGSGMMSGGRVRAYAKALLSDPTTRLFFVGYQAEDTLGYQILQGVSDVVIDKIHVHIKATVNKTDLMSSHADQPRLMTWLRHIKGAQQVFLIHGDDIPRLALKNKILDEFETMDVQMPMLDQKFEIENSL